MLGKLNHYGTLKTHFFSPILAGFSGFFIAACAAIPTGEKLSTGSEPAPAVNVGEAADTQRASVSDEAHQQDLLVPVQQQGVEIKDSAPEQYTVRRGDTLWDISNRYLEKPWRWKEIWHLNPQIQNPHLIYPGDVISIVYIAGTPYLSVKDGPRVARLPGSDSQAARYGGVKEGLRAARLPPKARGAEIDEEAYEIAIPTIQQFIIRPRVVSEETLDAAPYILSSAEKRLAFGSGDRVYVRGFNDAPQGRYTVFRKGEALRDPKTNELLGYEAIIVGDGEIVRADDPATLDLTQTKREVLRGDRLLPVNFSEIDTEFIPQAPPAGTEGHVISLFDAISQVGTFQVVTLSLGERNGIEKGHVLEISQAGRIVVDPFESPGSLVDVELPEERSGRAMVFRTFEKVSYALVMETVRSIRVGDAAISP